MNKSLCMIHNVIVWYLKPAVRRRMRYFLFKHRDTDYRLKYRRILHDNIIIYYSANAVIEKTYIKKKIGPFYFLRRLQSAAEGRRTKFWFWRLLKPTAEHFDNHRRYRRVNIKLFYNYYFYQKSKKLLFVVITYCVI